MKNSTKLFQSKLPPVNAEKFRQCIFFKICEKWECFNYGRYNSCDRKYVLL